MGTIERLFRWPSRPGPGSAAATSPFRSELRSTSGRKRMLQSSSPNRKKRRKKEMEAGGTGGDSSSFPPSDLGPKRAVKSSYFSRHCSSTSSSGWHLSVALLWLVVTVLLLSLHVEAVRVVERVGASPVRPGGEVDQVRSTALWRPHELMLRSAPVVARRGRGRDRRGGRRKRRGRRRQARKKFDSGRDREDSRSRLLASLPRRARHRGEG